MESDNYSKAEELAKQLSEICSGVCDNQALQTVAQFIPSASTILNTVQISTQLPSPIMNTIGILNDDDVLGELTQQYNVDFVIQEEVIRETINFSKTEFAVAEQHYVDTRKSNQD